MKTVFSGSCLCGAVHYSGNAPLRPVIACHCVQCRKTSGHHVAATSASREAIRISGDITWYVSSDTARRGFCGTCGSNLFWDGAGVNMSIFAGTLDKAPELHLVGHIFCADKGDYYEIDDDLPQFEGANAEMSTMVPE